MAIELELTWLDAPAHGIDSAGVAWGKGLLRVNDREVWFQDSPNGPAPIEWSWIELLEFLGQRWAYLATEQAYPLALVPDEPGQLRRALKRRWEGSYFEEEERDREDELVFRFEDCHDLSRALRGISLPSVWALREGQCFVVSTEGDARRVPYEEVISDLERIGDRIAERVSAGRPSERSRIALQQWSQRALISELLLIRLATGIAANDFTSRLPADNLEFWELELAAGADSELAAAARLVASGYASERDRLTIVTEVRKVPLGDTTLLDTLARSVAHVLLERSTADAFEQGYALAMAVRNVLQCGDKIDPEAVLSNLGVPVVSTSMSPAIDAVGCWGRKHGPAVILNTAGKRSQADWGRRATLAHELCHLLVDRSRSLPLAEVLGGRSPYLPERRANAFAAEFLLPRYFLRESFTTHRTVSATLSTVMDKFAVGRILAANQLKNCKPRPTGLTAAHLAELEGIIEEHSDDPWR